MSTTHGTPRRFSDVVTGNASPRRWLILAVICSAALMIVLDVTVMNLALPSAQHALGFTNADRQWIGERAIGYPLLAIADATVTASLFR